MGAARVCFTPRGLREFLLCEPRLQEILLYAADDVWPPTDLIVGDVHRTHAENVAAGAKTQIHVLGPPYRAIDARVINLSGDHQAAADAIGARINARYDYDPARTELNLHVAVTFPHGTGPHVHFQVCPGTTLREGG